MSDLMRRGRPLAALTAATLVTLAGCASGDKNGDAKPAAPAPTPKTTVSAEPAPRPSTATTEAAPAAPASVAAAPASAASGAEYALVEGKKAPVPAIPMGDAAVVRRILDEGKNRNQVMDHLTHITTKIGPRLTGSTNVETANVWAK